MTDTEFAELKADIEANGLREPITMYEGKILDGRHRARACEELGIEVLTRDYSGDEPVVFVVSMNVHRRHLHAGQKAEIARRVLPQLREEAKRRQSEAGAKAAPGRPAPKGPDTGPEVSDGEAREQAGKLVGVSGPMRVAIMDAG
ncbi:MAG: ParB/RepB/Spo0J family partition protein [Solirubrobacterales bacterium]